jgi:hypothetical protein
MVISKDNIEQIIYKLEVLRPDGKVVHEKNCILCALKGWLKYQKIDISQYIKRALYLLNMSR